MDKGLKVICHDSILQRVAKNAFAARVEKVGFEFKQLCRGNLGTNRGWTCGDVDEIDRFLLSAEVASAVVLIRVVLI